jgi:hypothetical protein
VISENPLLAVGLLATGRAVAPSAVVNFVLSQRGYRLDVGGLHPSVKTLQILDSQFRANLADLGLADADEDAVKAQTPPSPFNKNSGFRKMR